MRAKRSVALSLLVLPLCVLPRMAQATFLPPITPETQFALFNTGSGGATPATVAYNAATESLTATVPFGPAGAPASLVALSTFSIKAGDIFGSFSLAATIDHAGNVLGGSFTLTGASASLGLASQTLLTGSITDDGFNSGIFQLSGGVTSLASGLGAVVGPLASAKLDFIGIPDLFTSNFSHVTASESPDIFLVSAVPEPASGLIFAAGGAALLLLRRRRRR